MRFESLDRLGISPWKMLALGAAGSFGSALVTTVSVGGSLGPASPFASVVVAALVFYIVVSAPRRLSDAQRMSQARETPSFSASATACLAVTGSRPRTIVLLRSRDSELNASLEEAGRRVLLGTRVESAVDNSARALVSYSARAAVRGLAAFSPKAIAQGDEETVGLESSSDLSRETKMPMLMTACFFGPIMLTLYAVFSHSYDPASLGELASFEFILLDLALYLSAGDRAPR